MRLSFVRSARPVYLGGRSFGIGPLRKRWGGRQVLVGPITFINALLLPVHVNECGGPLLLVAGHENVPLGVARSMIPFFVADWSEENDAALLRSTERQVREALAVVAAVNGWDEVRKLVEPSPRDPSGPRPDEGALDRTVVRVAQEFGMWPHDVMTKPHVEVMAAIDALSYDPERKELDSDTAALIRKLSAERAAREAQEAQDA